MSKAKRNPAALAGADRVAMSKKHLVLITQNNNPRQPWRSNVPMRRIPVSSELLSFLAALGCAHD